MKYDSTKVLSAAVAVATLLMGTSARADSNRLLLAPNAKGVAVACGLDQYNNKVASIRHFSTAEDAVSFGPLVAGGGLIYLIAQGGGASGWAAGIPLGIMAVGGINYGVIRLVKHVEAHHYVEVANNLGEAMHVIPGDKALRHTTGLIDDMDPKGNWTEDQVAQALMDAARAGDLCDAHGKLDVTGRFRKVVLAHLKGEPVADINRINGLKAVPARAEQADAALTGDKAIAQPAASGSDAQLAAKTTAGKI